MTRTDRTRRARSKAHRPFLIERLEGRSLLAADFGSWFEEAHGFESEGFEVEEVHIVRNAQTDSFPSQGMRSFAMTGFGRSHVFDMSFERSLNESRDFARFGSPIRTEWQRPELRSPRTRPSGEPSGSVATNDLPATLDTTTGLPDASAHLIENVAKPVVRDTPHNVPTTNSGQISQLELANTLSSFISQGSGRADTGTPPPRAPLSLEVVTQPDGSTQQRFVGDNSALAPATLNSSNTSLLSPTYSATKFDSEGGFGVSGFIQDSFSSTLTDSLPHVWAANDQHGMARVDLYMNEFDATYEDGGVQAAWNRLDELLDQFVRDRSEQQTAASTRVSAARMNVSQQAWEQRDRIMEEGGFIALSTSTLSGDVVLDISNQNVDALRTADTCGLMADMGLYHAFEFAGLALPSAQAELPANTVSNRFALNGERESAEVLATAAPMSLSSRAAVIPELLLFSGIFYWFKRYRRPKAGQHGLSNRS